MLSEFKHCYKRCEFSAGFTVLHGLEWLAVRWFHSVADMVETQSEGTSKMKVGTILLGWNDAKLLPRVLRSLIDQTHPHKIIYVDDGSTDDSVEIVRSFGITDIIVLKRKKRTYGGFPILAENVNAGLSKIKEISGFDFFMVMPSDVTLEKQYLEKLMSRFDDDKLVIGSGVIRGEYNVESVPRGAGRVIRLSFWNKYIKWFPDGFLWESYAVHKAQSLGFKTRSFNDIHMTVLRPTRQYKPLYGYAMKELGYSKPYAYARCLKAFLHQPKIGIRIFRAYNSQLQPFDNELSAWIKEYQIHHLLSLIRNPIKLLERF